MISDEFLFFFPLKIILNLRNKTNLLLTCNIYSWRYFIIILKMLGVRLQLLYNNNIIYKTHDHTNKEK